MTLTLPNQLGTLVLCVWLIAAGALQLLEIGSAQLSMALNVLAIVAGALLLFERKHATFTKGT